MANKSFIEENPEIIQSFVRAVQRGQEWVANHSPTEIAEVIAPFFPHSNLDDLTFIVNRYQSQDTWPQDLAVNQDGFYLLQTIMEHGGELQQWVDFSSLIDNSFTSN